MKILQINNYHYVKGGSEKVYFETSKLLEEHGHQVIHFSVNDRDALESPDKKYFVEPVDYMGSNLFKKIQYVFRFIYSTEARFKLEQLIREKRPDVAHLHIYYGRITSSILPVLKRFKIPTVMTVHEYRMLCPVYTFLTMRGDICEKCARGNYCHCVTNKCNKGSLPYSIISALECYARDRLYPFEKYIDKFIMVSEFIAGKVMQYRPFLRDKITINYNFVDTAECSPERAPGDYYLYFGRLSREKGLLTLLKAWEKFPHLVLNIAGDGSLKEELLKYVRMKSMQNVNFLGHLTESDLSKKIKYSKFIIVPSEWYENNPMSIIEALALSKPVIGASIGGIPELIKDNMNGYLFQSGNIDSLRDAVKKAEHVSRVDYTALSSEARKTVEEKFNKESHYRILMQVYEDVTR